MQSIDILLATYNGAKYLPEQLASLDAQTHTNWALIVRDDGSTDGSLEIVRNWAERTSRPIQIIEDNDTRVGPAESFGRLLARSTSPYFAFCDQDDVWAVDKLTHLLEAALRAPEGVLLAHCDLAVVNEALSLVAPSFWHQQQNDAELRSGAPQDRTRLFFQNPVTGCAMLGNAALREKMLPIPDAVSMHDWWATLTAAFSGQIIPVDTPLVNYRQHDHNSVGARERTFGKMITTLFTEPAAGFKRTWKIFDRLAQQTQATLDRYEGTMNAKERAFAVRFSLIRDGLRRLDGWWMLGWSVMVRRRWPLAAYIVSTTVRPSDGQTGNPHR